jgi:hypothetical protein
MWASVERHSIVAPAVALNNHHKDLMKRWLGS